MPKWNTNNVKYMNGVFANFKSLSSLPDISKWSTDKVIRLNSIFSNCLNLSNLPNI